MKKKLIVVADDFGFSEAYNYGVMKAYQEGIVTVVSLMTNMDAASHAVKLASEFPEINITQHTNFVSGHPVSDPKEIPSMVDENGRFYRSTKWAPTNPKDTKCRGSVVVSYEDAKKETLAQMARFKMLTGHYPNHFEGHSTGTALIDRAFLEICDETRIHCMTLLDRETELMKPAHELIMESEEYMIALHRGLCVEDFINSRGFGLLDSPFEINVMHFHPGYVDAFILDNSTLTTQRCRDLQVLCDPRIKSWISEHEIELTDFNAVYK